MRQTIPDIKILLKDWLLFMQEGSQIELRSYQQGVAKAVIDSVTRRQGLSLVIIFPRQSGKNELQAQIETYLLLLYAQIAGEIVKVSPTWKPQSQNAMRRLERVLRRNEYTRDVWKKEAGYIYRLEGARVTFLSGSPEANIVGATASTLLEVDEAQDVLISKFDRDIAPMAASTNATRVFWGTAWTARTLLAREFRAAREAELQDGLKRTFLLSADQVIAEVPEYGKYVAAQVAQLGRSHPMVRTQYYSEEIEAESSMFPPARLALMQGSHPANQAPRPERLYAFLIDVAGEDEAQSVDLEDSGIQELANPRRDATALTVVEVDLSSVMDDLIKAPTFRVMQRAGWIGVKHSTLYRRIKALAETWQPRYLVIDATGVGAGLTSFLDKSFPGRVIPFLFTRVTKSKLGWDFLAVVDTGRFRDYASQDEAKQVFFQQLAYCQSEIMPGPEHRMKWGVPDGTRDLTNGELVHDDWVLSAALCSVLQDVSWSVFSRPILVQAADPLKAMDREQF
jgi:hypothetical protein